MKLEPVSSDRHLRDLRVLFDETEAHLRSLRLLRISSNSYSLLLSPVLLSKLPPDLQLIVIREVPDSDLDLDKLLKQFGSELVARKRAALQYTPPSKKSQDNRTLPTASTLFTSQREFKDPQCAYFKSPHTSISCPTVPDATAHKRTLRRTARCYNCLRRGHISQACQSPSRCQKCKGKHHTSICEANSKQNSPPSLATSTQSNLSTSVPLFTPAVNKTTTTVYSNNSQIVHLQTARAMIKNPSNVKASVEV